MDPPPRAESLCPSLTRRPTQSLLCGAFFCPRPTPLLLTNRGKNGILIRKLSDLDSRINYLELTNKGLEMALFLKEDRKITEDIMLDGISDEEYLIFTQIVDKIRRNLERI